MTKVVGVIVALVVLWVCYEVYRFFIEEDD